jgi:hypothetical protein
MVRVTDGKCDAEGMPTIVSVRSNMRQRLSPFPRGFPSIDDLPCLTIEEALSDKHVLNKPNSTENRYMTPAQFAWSLGIEQVGGGSLQALIFPSITEEVEDFAVRRLRPETATGLIQQYLFGSTGFENSISLLSGIDVRDMPGTDQIRSLCHEIASAVSCYECKLGPHAYVGDGLRESLELAATGKTANELI